MYPELCIIGATILGATITYFSCKRTIMEDERVKLVQP
jgi:hypothetical protein